MDKIIQATFTSIRKQDLASFRRLLPLLKVQELEEEQSSKLLDLISRVILDNAKNPRVFLQEGYTEWKRNYPPEKHVIGEMLRAPFIPDEVIRDVTKVLGFYFRDFITALASYPDSGKNVDAIERMHRLVGLQSAEEYKSCLKLLRPRLDDKGKPESRVNMYLYRFLESQLQKVTVIIDEPSYIIHPEHPVEWEDEEGVNDPTSIPRLLPSPEEAAKLIIESLSSSIMDFSNADERRIATEKIARDYEKEGSDRMRIRMLQPIYIEYFGLEKQDPERFRMWGPSNPFVVSAKEAMDEMSSRYFTCIRYVKEDEFDYLYLPNNDEDYQSFDWFKGFCERCNKRIRWYHHARRMPMEDGGWSGCYCSDRCIEKDLASEGDLVDQVSPYPMRLNLLKFFAPMFEEYGIYDRPIEVDADLNEREFDSRTEEMILAALEKEKGEEEEMF